MSRAKQIVFIIGIGIFSMSSFSCVDNESASKANIAHMIIIDKYQKKLEKEPNNCFFLGQVAANYQAINDLSNAILYYRRELDNCPDNLIDKFQLGVCYYLLMDREKALKLMDEAIDGAEKDADNILLPMLKKEKELWLEKWESVKELEWNKKREKEAAGCP